MKKTILAALLAITSMPILVSAGGDLPSAPPALASNHLFVALTAGYVTNKPYGIDNVAAWLKKNEPLNLFTFNNENTLTFAGLQVGAELVSLGSGIGLGAELDNYYGLTKPRIQYTETAGETHGDESSINIARWSIDPMVFIAFNPTKRLTLKVKAGYGYQHLNIKGIDPIESINIPTSSSADRSFDKSIGKFEPVLAAEADLNITEKIAVIAGDRYTFGKLYEKNAILATLDPNLPNIMPHQNLLYAGLQYTF